MKFKKKAIVFMLVLALTVCFVLPVGAVYVVVDGKMYPFDETENLSTNVTVSPDSETVITRNPDGTITEKTYDFSSILLTATHTEAYIPNNNTYSLTSNEGDEYGRYRASSPDDRIGRVYVEFDYDKNGTIDKAFYGTGTLIGEDLLLSCAHLVWKKHFETEACEGWASSIVFQAGFDAGFYEVQVTCHSPSISMGYVNNTNVYIDDTGEKNSSVDANYDWSLIRTSQSIGTQVGWFGVQICNGTEIGLSVETIGYPSDKSPRRQWISPGAITNFIQANIMQYSSYVVPGNSGGPVLDNENIIGIHSVSFSDSTGAFICAGAMRIDSGFFAIINSELAE